MENLNLNNKPITMKKATNSRPIFSLLGMAIAVVFLLSACNTSQKKSDAADEVIEPPTKEEVIEDLSGYPIPTSFELTELIYEAGAPYILSLSNEPGNADNYITQKDKALNLGIYGADLCYASTYMMKQGTMLYLEASKTLLDEMGIATPFNEDYAQRVEGNLDDRDSLIMIVGDSFYDTWDYLVGNQQDVLARLVVCGSWIEGIYISANIAQSAKDPEEIMEVLAKQKNSLDKIVAILEPVKDTDDVAVVFKGLFDLQSIFEDVGDVMTEEQLEKVSTRVATLREAII